MHAFLITGSTKENRSKRVEELLLGVSERIIILPEKNILIEEIRNLIKQFILSPQDQEKGRGVIVENAHLLTQDAANAFLKTLENPPGKTLIVLTAPNRELVLETIASRCQHIFLGSKINLDDKTKNNARELVEKILNTSIGDRFLIVDEIKDRGEAEKFCQDLIIGAREGMLKSPNPELLDIVELADKTIENLNTNVNTKATLSELMLNIPNH